LGHLSAKNKIARKDGRDPPEGMTYFFLLVMHFFIVYFMKKVCREPLVKLAPEKTLAILPSWAQGAPPTVPHTVKTVATPSIFDRNGPHDTLDGPEASISAGITRWYNYFDPLAPCGSPLDTFRWKCRRQHAPMPPAEAPRGRSHAHQAASPCFSFEYVGLLYTLTP